MLNTLSIYEDLSRYMDQQAARKIAELMGQVYEEIAQTVTKKEFRELRSAVLELAEAQKRTEARVEELAEAQKRTEARVEQLAEAQKRTEARVEELAEAQKRTEARVEELAEAQKRTEARVEELAEAQKRTEARVEELARAQERTEESLNRLIGEHRETRERLENMSDAVGYNLENQSYKGLPQLLLRDYGLQVQGKLIRKYLPGKKKGKYFQANIYGWGNKDGEKILILGEAKTSISRKEVNRFQKKINKMAELEDVPLDKVLQVIVVHDVTPGVEEYAKEQGFHLYWSYDL